ncbi:hypothetical protein CA12_15090 [Alienimonas californiensis]|uniref:Uncharacterized protein n=2 Tax=Alienimonas californiensis TaxID=2527989 RepID=A0A517P7R5_9PLAN|nr:hypothetical protein CA12_15090 [Alienimonas californiensis]
MPNDADRPDVRCVEAFVQYLTEHGLPGLQIVSQPDKETGGQRNKDKPKAIDAVTNALKSLDNQPFFIEHTSLDVVPRERKISLKFRELVEGLSLNDVAGELGLPKGHLFTLSLSPDGVRNLSGFKSKGLKKQILAKIRPQIVSAFKNAVASAEPWEAKFDSGSSGSQSEEISLAAEWFKELQVSFTASVTKLAAGSIVDADSKIGLCQRLTEGSDLAGGDDRVTCDRGLLKEKLAKLRNHEGDGRRVLLIQFESHATDIHRFGDYMGGLLGGSAHDVQVWVAGGPFGEDLYHFARVWPRRMTQFMSRGGPPLWRDVE